MDKEPTSPPNDLLLKINIPEKSISSQLRFEPNFTVVETITRIVKRYPVENIEQYGLFKDNQLLPERATLAELELTKTSALELRKLSTISALPVSQTKGTRAAKTRTKVIRYMFGIPLKDVLYHQKEKHPDLKIPLFIKNAIALIIQSGLDFKGLFRIAGTTDSVIAMRDAWDRGEEIDFVSEATPVNDVCDLLKMFFRNLPDSLLTTDMFDSFTAVYKMMRLKTEEVRQHQLSRITSLLSFIPEANRKVLQAMMTALHLIEINSQSNGMTIDEIATIFGPIFLWKKANANVSITDLQNRDERKGIMKLLLEEYDALFAPGEEQFNVAQIRRLTRSQETRKMTIRLKQQESSQALVSRGRLSWVLELLEDELREQYTLEQEYQKIEWAIFRRKFVGHKKSVQCLVEVTVDGEMWVPHQIWSGDTRGILRVWDAERLRFVKEIDTGISQRLQAMIAVQNRYVWCGFMTNLLIFDAKSMLLVKDVPMDVYSFVQVGATIWSGGERKVSVWEAKTAECVSEIPVEGGLVSSMVYDEARHRVWAAVEKSIYIWDVETGSKIAEMSHHKHKICSLALIEDKFWTGADDETLSLWNPVTFELIRKIDANLGAIYGMLHFGNFVWTFGWDLNIYVWDPQQPTCFSRIGGVHTDSISCVLKVWSTTHRCHFAWSASWDKSICVWIVHPKNTETIDLSHSSSNLFELANSKRLSKQLTTQEVQPAQTLTPLPALQNTSPPMSSVRKSDQLPQPKLTAALHRVGSDLIVEETYQKIPANLVDPESRNPTNAQKSPNSSFTTILKDIDNSLDSLWAEFDSLKDELSTINPSVANISRGSDSEDSSFSSDLILSNVLDTDEEVMNNWQSFINAIVNGDNQILSSLISTPSTFSTVIKGFGVKHFVERVQAIASLGYFYNFMSTYEAKRFLELEPRGVYLVRCSLSKPFCFVMEYVSEFKTSTTAYLIRSHHGGFVVELEQAQEVYSSIEAFVDAKKRSGILFKPLISKIPKMPWFHGEMKAEEAQAALVGSPVGTFLVRFSSQSGCYAISYVGEDGNIAKSIVTRSQHGFQFSAEGPAWPSLEELLKAYDFVLRIPYVKPTLPDV